MIEHRDQALFDELLAAGCSDLVMVRALTGRNSLAQMDELGLPGAQIVAALAGTPLRPPS